MARDSRLLRDALRGVLQRHRAAIDPADYDLYRGAPQGRRAAGLGCTQEHINLICGFGCGTYERLESGRYRNAPEHVLQAVGELFDLSVHEWTLLWRMTWRRDPPHSLSPAECELPGGWQEVLDGVRHPAYITTDRWDLVAYNEAFPAIFPDRQVPENTMEWMLLAPDARRTLDDWEGSWAPLIAPQLWAARAAHPADPFLAALEERVLADRLAGPIYRAFREVYVHPDGATRPFHHPEHGAGWVNLCTSTPRTSPRFINMVLVFHPGTAPPPSPPPLRVSRRTA